MIKKDEKVWDLKFLKEYPFMPFGSLMNAFGNINQGKGMDYVAFETASKNIFKMAKSFVKEQYEESINVKKDENEKEKQLAFGDESNPDESNPFEKI